MKSFFRTIVAYLLAILARAILRTYKPKIVMVTGSVGKTSTKDAVACALAGSYNLRASEKSYNSEFGVPLTIIGAGNPWFDVGAWVRVLQRACSLIFIRQSYPELLVLEVGADRPGDLKHILRVVTPDALVVTRLPDIPVHVEAYASAEAVREEEFAPAYTLPHGAPLVICADDAHAKRLAARVSATVSTFGFAEDATVRIADVQIARTGESPVGMQATVQVDSKEFILHAPRAIGRSQVFAPSAAFALARALGMKTDAIVKGLQTYEPPAGRGKILTGLHDSIIIDDTYNASPAAVEEVLHSLGQIHATRKIAVLGDMLELGRYSVGEHERIGRLASAEVDVVVSVGVRARAIAESARKEHASEVMEFPDSFSAAPKLKEYIQTGDVILIKGSQSIRMERIVEALLKDPHDVSKLVRQDPEWLKK